MKIFILLSLASLAGAARSSDNRRFTSCPSALAYLDDKSEASQDALSAEFWEHVKKDPALKEYTLSLMSAGRKSDADAKRMRDFFCVMGTVLASIKHNLASGKWNSGGWGKNTGTNESGQMLDPNNVADNPRAARRQLERLEPDFKALKKLLVDSASEDVVWKGQPWKRTQLKKNFKRISEEYRDYSTAVTRTYGLCRHWANDNAAAMSEVPQRSYKVGTLSVYDPYSFEAAFGMAKSSEHNVAQLCQADCAGPCFVVDAWGGTRIIARVDFMKGYRKMNEGAKFCD